MEETDKELIPYMAVIVAWGGFDPGAGRWKKVLTQTAILHMQKKMVLEQIRILLVNGESKFNPIFMVNFLLCMIRKVFSYTSVWLNNQSKLCLLLYRPVAVPDMKNHVDAAELVKRKNQAGKEKESMKRKLLAVLTNTTT